VTLADIANSSRADTSSSRPVHRLVLLGDSTAVGLGDPLPGGGWRGVGPLVAEALGVPAVGYLNCSFTGARMRCVRDRQLSRAVAHRADVAVLVAGMNDTLRSDFDPVTLVQDMNTVVRGLRSAGSTVVTVRFHDHGRVFRLPGPLHRALKSRIDSLNSVIDDVISAADVPCVDLALVPETYTLAAWSVDRLHPSEIGHRLLARGITEVLDEQGFAVPHPVDLRRAGGADHGTLDHVGWLLVKGVPWLWRRGRDLLPHAAGIMLRAALRRPASKQDVPAAETTAIAAASVGT
jgi:lysophospholipase L1-like esterase